MNIGNCLRTEPAAPHAAGRRVRLNMATFFCVIKVQDYRQLYLGDDYVEAVRVNLPGTYLAEAANRGDAIRLAALAVGYLRRGLKAPESLPARGNAEAD